VRVHTIVIASQKGGVGKTTVALNLAAALAERGRRTLLIDLDPQGAIGHSLARADTALPGVADLLSGVEQPEAVVMQTRLPTLALLPRGRLDPIDACDFEQTLGTAGVLESVVERCGRTYDYVLVDTPAGVGSITRGAMRAGNSVLIPFQAEPLALRTLSQVLRVMDHVRAAENPSLRLLGILLTMVDRTNEAGSAVLGEAWSGFASVLDTVIPRNEVFTRASLAGLPIGFLGGRVSPEARRFELLANEVEALLAEEKGLNEERPQRQLL
jgi:chromosome partitioning protein